jgi:glucose/arabinose dehydrogenase
MRRTIRLIPLLAAIAAVPSAVTAQRQNASPCSNQLATITVPAGFCIEQVADSLTGLRHIAVAANGDLFAAARAGLFVLHDRNRDGVYETRTRLYDKSGNDVVLRGPNTLYYTTPDAVMRIQLKAGDAVSAVDTIVQGLPTGGHTTKSIAFDKAGALYVDIGSRSNVCEAGRGANAPGPNPCTELQDRAGVWKFDARRPHQLQKDGTRVATGVRNMVAFTSHPQTGRLYGVQHGRDQLASWGFSAEQNAELPSEILMEIEPGADFGWPYCYYDHLQKKTVLAPEYGGDGKTVGRCSTVTAPLAGYPGHWAPEAIVFSTGTRFPAAYREGAFISFHGSWNRAPLPQAGYRVIFQPFRNGVASGPYVDFAMGFEKTPAGSTGTAGLRPMGLATGPDGALYVGSDTGGRVWRIRAR